MAAAKVPNVRSASSRTPKKRAPPSEKRRLQNREAQRKYREKMKVRLQNLERLAEQASPESEPSLQQHDNSSHQIEFEPSLLPVDEVHTSYLSKPAGPNHIEWQGATDLTATGEARGFDIASESSDIPNLLSSTTTEDLPSEIDETNFWIPNDLELSNQEFPQLDESNPEIWSPEPIAQGIPSTAACSQESSMSNVATYQWSTSPTRTITFGNLSCISPQISSTASSEPNRDHWMAKPPRVTAADRKKINQEIIETLRLDDTKENQCLLSTAMARGHNIRDVFLAGLQAMGETSSAAKLPSLQKNTLKLVRVSTVEAYLSVAQAANIHIPSLYLEDTPSPFYKPNATQADVASLLPQYASRMPVDLRPTAPQIMFPHRPWLDLLPFPTMRERALILTSLNPPLFDLMDLKKDIFLNNGLFCWQNSQTKGTGHPWDRRSWEAEEWFLKKWWILIGEEADVVFQTRWWRELRGEGRLELGWGKVTRR